MNAGRESPALARRAGEVPRLTVSASIRQRYRTFAALPALPNAPAAVAAAAPPTSPGSVGMRERSGTGVGPAVPRLQPLFSPTGVRPSSPSPSHSPSLGSAIGGNRIGNVARSGSGLRVTDSPAREATGSPRSDSRADSPALSGKTLRYVSPTPAAPVAAGPRALSLTAAMDRAFELIKTRKQSECRFNGRRLEREHVRHLTTLVLQQPTVTFIDLRYSGLGDAEGVVLAKLIKLHAPLTGIDLAGNAFSAATLEQIADAVGRNTNVTSCVVLAASDADTQLRDAQRRLEQLCEQNRLCQKARAGSHTEVRLGGRQLQHVDWVFAMTHLTALDISANGLVALPSAIEAMGALERLILSRNQLDALPAEICSLPRLAELNVSENQLEQLPAQIGSMPALTLLDVRSNLLRELPKALGSLKTLKTLRCADNRWRKEMVVPKHVLAKGDDAILHYLRNLASSGEAHISRMKLMVVGNANVGKTSLLKALRGVPREKGRITTNLATDGISVSLWAPDEKITFYCWDFAGQEVYYATHQFFLTPNSLYLVAFNLLEDVDTGKLAYWLENIYLRAGRAPVVLVGTHLDEIYKDVLTRQMVAVERIASSYRHVALITSVSATTGKGVRELGKELVRIAAKQKWMQRVVPRSYARLAERLTSLKDGGGASGAKPQAYIDWGTYRRAAAESGISEEELSSATDYLVNVGEIAFTPERRAPAGPARDRELVVLDSMWLTKAFASLISLKTSFIRDGTLASSALPHVWAAYPADVVPFLLALFERYELLYQTADSQLVVPLLLREARPTAAEFDTTRAGTDASTEVTRVFLFDVLPIGFFSRWIVKIIGGGYKPALVWRTGIVALDVAHSSWVHSECDPRENAVRLVLRGSSTSETLVRLHNELAAFTREWAKLQFKAVFAGCPHCPNHRLPLSQLSVLPASTTSILCPATNLPLKLSVVYPDRVPPADSAALAAADSNSSIGGASGSVRDDASSQSSDADARDETTTALLDNLVTEMNRTRAACRLAEQYSKSAAKQRLEAATTLIDTVAELPRALEQCSTAASRLRMRAQLAVADNGLEKRLSAVSEQHLRLLEALRGHVSALETAVRELIPSTPLLLKGAAEPADLEASAPVPPPAKAQPASPADYARTVTHLKSLQAVIQAVEGCVWVHNVVRVQQRTLTAKAARCAELKSALLDLQKQLDSASEELTAASSEAASGTGVLGQLQELASRLQPLVAGGRLLDQERALTAETATLLNEYRTLAKSSAQLADSERHEELYGLRSAPSEDKDTAELKLLKKEGEHAQVRAGTVNALIERLTFERHPDLAFQRAFLLTYRSFVSPVDLLEKLIFRYCVTPVPSVSSDLAKQIRGERQLPIRLRVMGVLKYWVENHSMDFVRDAALCAMLIDFLRDVVSATGHRKFAAQLKSTLDKKLEQQEHGPHRRVRAQNPPPEPLLPDVLRQPGGAARLTTADVEPLELARQLALLSFELLCNIQSSELLGAAWQSKNKAVLAPNVLAMIQNFNRVSFFVVHEILRTPDAAGRRVVLKRWILVAREAHRLNNFDGLMAIVAALEKTAVRRLKRTWEGLEADVVEIFQQLIDITSINYQKLKDQVRAATPPRVPYIGVYLTDLMYTEEQPSVVDGGLINFAKLRKVALIIQDIQASQEHTYNLKLVPDIQHIFRNWKMPWKDDDTLDEQIFSMSLRLEPREAALTTADLQRPVLT